MTLVTEDLNLSIPVSGVEYQFLPYDVLDIPLWQRSRITIRSLTISAIMASGAAATCEGQVEITRIGTATTQAAAGTFRRALLSAYLFAYEPTPGGGKAVASANISMSGPVVLNPGEFIGNKIVEISGSMGGLVTICCDVEDTGSTDPLEIVSTLPALPKAAYQIPLTGVSIP